LIDNVRQMTGVTISTGDHRKTIRHGVTRFRITLNCYDAEYVSHNGGGKGFVQKWIRPAELEHLPMSSTGRQLAKLV
jgi:A/G-specific adenine glycosylase